MDLCTLFNTFEIELDNSNVSLYSLIPIAEEYRDEDWNNYVTFSDVGYQKKIVHRGYNVEILVISWKKGQRSKVHNHPENGCILLVRKGVLREKRYRIDTMCPDKETELGVGDVSYIDNREWYHAIEALEDSVSIHIYSPPNYHPTYFSIPDYTS